MSRPRRHKDQATGVSGPQALTQDEGEHMEARPYLWMKDLQDTHLTEQPGEAQRLHTHLPEGGMRAVCLRTSRFGPWAWIGRSKSAQAHADFQHP